MKAALLSLLITPTALAECDFAKDITVRNDGVLYSHECHKTVGKLLMDRDVLLTQVKSYQDLVNLQKQHLAEETARAELWKTNSESLQHSLSKIQSAERINDFTFYGAGILTTILSAWALNQASK